MDGLFSIEEDQYFGLVETWKTNLVTTNWLDPDGLHLAGLCHLKLRTL